MHHSLWIVVQNEKNLRKKLSYLPYCASEKNVAGDMVFNIQK